MRRRDAEEAGCLVVDEVVEVKLCLLTDLRTAGVEETLARARAVLAAADDPSIVLFAVRDHEASARVRVSLARALIAVARAPTTGSRPRRHGVRARVVVHDRIDVVLAAEADGVHLAERSIDLLDARQLLGDRYVGRSCHGAAGIAAAGDCDAVTLSPLFASPGKAAPLGVVRFAEIARGASVPVIALGGITAANAREALAAGAAGVATIRGWLVEDPVALVREVEARG